EAALGGQVDGTAPRVLVTHDLGNHCRIGWKRSGPIGQQQRPAIPRNVLDPLLLHAKPVVVEKAVERAVDEALDPLGAPPISHLAIRLQTRKLPAQVVCRRCWQTVASGPIHGRELRGHAGFRLAGRAVRHRLAILAGVGARRGRAQRGIAPSAALETSLAYLLSAAPAYGLPGGW